MKQDIVTFKTLRVILFIGILFILSVMPATVPSSLAADEGSEAKKFVETSRFTLESFLADPNYEDFRNLLKRAKGVLIVPQKIRGAFLVGAKGGSGVLFVRDPESNTWNGPAFYTLGGISFGLQAGGSVSEVILLIMTDRGVNSLMASSIKLGANVSIAAGPVGAGVSAETANLSADILSFARSKGLYAGLSLNGAVVAARSALNKAYYGKSVNSADILIVKSVANPHAQKIIEVLTTAAKDN